MHKNASPSSASFKKLLPADPSSDRNPEVNANTLVTQPAQPAQPNMLELKLSNLQSEGVPEESPTKEDDASPKDMNEAIDDLQKKMGGFGRYQILIYFLMGIVYMRGCWHAFVSIFQGADPGYHCRAAPGLPLNQSVPHTNDSVYDSCKQFVNFTLGNETEDCTRGWDYLYADSHMTSIVSEFTLTCDRNYLIELSTTMYMVGATCGVIFLTPLSERFGGKKVMLVCLWLQAIVGTVLPWAGGIVVFLVLKFFIGLFNMTIALCVAVLMHETFDSTHREIPSIGVQFFWAFGIMSLALFGYLLPDWKHLQLVITLPVPILSIAFIWLIPDPLPWLISKGKLKDAARVIKRFISINRLPSIPDLDDTLSGFTDKSVQDSSLSDNSVNSHLEEGSSTERIKNDESPPQKVYTVLDILQSRRLTLWSLILCYLFLVNSLAYFGVMFLLDGNQFLDLFYSGLVEIPAYIASIILHKWIGRRRSISLFMFICGVSSIVIRFVPDVADDGTDLADLKLFISLVQKFGITGSYSAIYLFASEVFPTVLRNQGVGFCSFFENLGSIAAPNMVQASRASTTLPLTIFGVLTLVGCVAVLFLPETHHRPLPQTIEDVEGRKESA